MRSRRRRDWRLLDVLEDENGPAKLVETGNTMIAGFQEAARKLSVPLQMIGPPSFCEPVFGEGDIHDYRSYATTNRAAARQFGIELLKRDMFVHPASKLYMSTMHSETQIEAACAAAFEAMRTVRDAGLLE